MYGDFKIKIGIVPTRRDVFPPWPFSLESRDRIMPVIKSIFSEIDNVETVYADELMTDGLLMDLKEVPAVAKKLIAHDVDALFIPHVNFGQEEAVAKLAKAVGKPVLLWGPRDDVPPADLSTRHTDTQCGLFVSGKALRSYGIPFTYIENCWLDSPLLKEGIEEFIRVATVVKRMKGLRVGQISVRPRQFLSVRVNEASLQEKLGIDVVAITGSVAMRFVRKELERKDDRFKSIQSEIREKVDLSKVTQEDLDKMTALECAYYAMADEFMLDVIAVDCWRTFPNELGIETCFANGDAGDHGLPVACECDVHGAISIAFLAAAARGETPPFLADLTIRHPSNDNGELLWHCGPFPKCLVKPGVQPSIRNCQGQYEIKGGDLTLCRFELDSDHFVMLTEDAKGIDGPPTYGNYVWAQFENWPALERKIVMGPYIHHVGVIHGKYQKVLREACRYLNITPDEV